MLTTTREFVTNSSETSVDRQASRTNDLFNNSVNLNNTLSTNQVSPEFSEPTRTRRFNIFGGRDEVVDARPSQETLTKLAVSAPEEKQESSIQMSFLNETNRGASLTRQNKIIIACFLVAIVALSFFMVVSAINLKNSSGLVEAQQASIENAENEIARLENEINSISGTDLQAKASKLGYGLAEESNSYSLLALSDYNVATSTNWFDGICNFVSSIIG